MTNVDFLIEPHPLESSPQPRHTPPSRTPDRGLLLSLLAVCAVSVACGPERPAALEETGPSTRAETLSGVPELSPWVIVSQPSPGAYQQVTAAAGNGIYLLVWASFNSSGPKIVGVRVRASDGVVLDSSPLVIGVSSSALGEPAVALDGTHFLVVWTLYQGRPRIVGARVRASDGAVLDTPALWLSNAPTPVGMLPHLRPAIAFDGTSNYLVAWEGTIYVNGFYTGIAATRVRAADGAILDSYPQFVGPGGTAWSGAGVRVAYTGGNFLVAWQSPGSVQAARVSTLTGQLLDSPPLSVTTAGANPGLAAHDGEFLVLWKGSDNGLWSRRLSAADGSKLGTADTFVGPAIAAPPAATFDGEAYWISWQGTRDGVRKALVTQVTAAGEIEADAEIVLGDIPDGSPSDRSAVAAAGQGIILTAYTMMDPVGGYTQVRMRLRL
jgi:hypothetical protein